MPSDKKESLCQDLGGGFKIREYDRKHRLVCLYYKNGLTGPIGVTVEEAVSYANKMKFWMKKKP